ncbi:hypothetical protein CspeluHIS016_0109820 [Cutaneotrichosporon spelunceum]|uniref:Cohesin loading factor-domain-containing protein n=1 Tax=Cutaneotrichosporon spelunceum TaxID=1672016 RepID=A0AAD3Y8X3_9TREE|nr:hypothetical protein CspeluHIS016_0109820 [Cutaneotrichosporon spelunceum]
MSGWEWQVPRSDEDVFAFSVPPALPPPPPPSVVSPALPPPPVVPVPPAPSCATQPAVPPPAQAGQYYSLEGRGHGHAFDSLDSLDGLDHAHPNAGASQSSGGATQWGYDPQGYAAAAGRRYPATESYNPKSYPEPAYLSHLNPTAYQETPPRQYQPPTQYQAPLEQQSYQQKPQSYQPKPESYQLKPQSFQTKQQSYPPPEQSYQSPKQHSYQPKPESYQPKQQSYQPKQQSYQPKPESYQPKQQSYQPKQQNYQPKQSYQSPPEPQQIYQPPEPRRQSYQPPKPPQSYQPDPGVYQPPPPQSLPEARYPRPLATSQPHSHSQNQPPHQPQHQQFHSTPLGQQPSFDAQLQSLQSLHGTQFESQGSNQSQSQSSYSPQSTQLQWPSQSPSSVSQQLPWNDSLPQMQPAHQPSPQLQTRPSLQAHTSMPPSLHAGMSTPLHQRSSQLQPGLSPQFPQHPPSQAQHRSSSQLQHPSPQLQHPSSHQFASPQQQYASPQMPVQSSPTLRKLPPHPAPQHVSPPPRQTYLPPPQPPPQQLPPQQPFEFQQLLPQQQLPQNQAYPPDVHKFDLTQWEQSLQQQPPPPPVSSQQQLPQQLPPVSSQQQLSQQLPPVSSQQQLPQQLPQPPAPQLQYVGYNRLGGSEHYGLAAPCSSRPTDGATKITAPSPTFHITAAPPRSGIQSSLSRPSPSPSHPHPPPMPKLSSNEGVPWPASTSQSVPSKRKSKASHPPQRAPPPPTPPSSRPSGLTQAAPAPLPEAIPTAPLLFHTAVSAHHNATFHLQQVFVPRQVLGGDKGGMKRETASGKVLFTHDPDALNTALRLLVIALDLLRTGFNMPNLSDSERAAFGLKFATVAAKVLATEDPVKRLLTKDELARVQVVIDHKRLASDVDDVMTKTLAAARSPHLKHYRQGVELVSARLAFMKDKANHAKRIIKQALAVTPREDVAHRYNLKLLHMNHLLKASNVELLQVVKEFEADARGQGYTDVVLLAHIIRIRAHFSLRRWDNLLATLDESQALFGTDDVFTSGDPATASFRLVLLMHYLNMRALYHGRAADDANAKKQLSRLYPLMDRAMEKGMLSELRSSGGVVTIPLGVPNGSAQQLLVQSTPINVLWALTYLSSVVARRDLLGSLTQCRTLNHTRAVRQFELCAHPDDLWDSGFSSRHGVAEALELRHKVNKLRAEVMMEEALALMCRSSFEEVTTLLSKTVNILHDNKLFLTHSHQLALLYGHLAHSIGLPDQAVRYYKAAQSLLVAGSEMRLIVDINLMAAQGGFANLQMDLDRSAQVNIMADQCRAGTNGALNAIGYFLLSLTDPERVSSKRKLTFSYEICRKGKLNILYALIFAFTTAQHLFGDRERQLKQLESGRDIARLLGGKDRADCCGQLPLGLWYSIKLRDHYRVDGRFDDEKSAGADAQRHLQRMHEVYAYGRTHLPLRIPI